MANLDDLLEAMDDSEVGNVARRVGKELQSRGAGGEHSRIPWGSLSDAEFQVQKQRVFAKTKLDARKKRIVDEHARLQPDAEALQDILNRDDLDVG